MRQNARRAAIVVAALLLAVSACAEQGTEGARLAGGEKLQITREVWASYQEYLRKGRALGPDRQGAFGVALVGSLGFAGLYTYTYCPREYDGCRPGGPTAIGEVLDTCRRENVECLIFARNEEIQVPYEIVD
jgi:hypothetical protein